MLPIVTYPSFVKTALPRFSSIFTKPQLRHFAEYLTGLVVSPNKTVSGMNAQFLNHTDQSSKNHFLTQSNWDDQRVTNERLKLVKEHCIKHHVKEGLLVIDDSGVHKTGHHIEAANWFWDHSKHSYAFGHQIVTSQFVTKKFHVPLHYRLYQKEDDVGKDAFQSKLDLAIELIDEAAETDIPFNCVAGDSWYFCAKIIRHLKSLAKDWIFACKSNRKVLFNNEWMQLMELVKQLSKSDFKQVTITKTNGQQLTVWAFAKTLRMNNVGRVKILISYLDNVFVGNPFFLVTNRKEWPIAKMLTVYSQRWPIETFYRDAKQHLGLKSCELRMLRGIRRHWELGFSAYTLLQIESCTGALSKWIKSNVVTIGGKSRVISCELFRAFIFWAHQHFDQGDKPEKLFERAVLKSRQLQFNF